MNEKIEKINKLKDEREILCTRLSNLPRDNCGYTKDEPYDRFKIDFDKWNNMKKEILSELFEVEDVRLYMTLYNLNIDVWNSVNFPK